MAEYNVAFEFSTQDDPETYDMNTGTMVYGVPDGLDKIALVKYLTNYLRNDIPLAKSIRNVQVVG